MTDDSRIRLDKWLWAARFFKTRALAKQAVEGGKVHYEGQRTKPSREVKTGALLEIHTPGGRFEVEVMALSDRRSSATVARTLYQETPDSIRLREQQAEQRQLQRLAAPIPEHRPNKKERRHLRQLKDRQP